MTKFFAILALALVPVLSQAKIGDKKADYEAAHGKPVKFSTIQTAYWSEEAREVLAKIDMHKSDFFPVDVQARDPVMQYKGVWYGLGKVIGEWYPAATKDETVIRALEESLGTSDLVEDFYPLARDQRAYRTEDYKFKALVLDGLGTLVGTQ
jgi:hypothetical protein